MTGAPASNPNVTITNTGGTVFSGWTLLFAFAGNQAVTGAWNAVATQSGPTVTVKDAGWNGTLAPSGTASFGFNGKYTGTNADPSAFSVNGVTCTGSAPPPPPPPPPTPTTSCAVKWTAEDWGNGFVASLTVSNTGTAAINGWKLEWALPRQPADHQSLERGARSIGPGRHRNQRVVQRQHPRRKQYRRGIPGELHRHQRPPGNHHAERRSLHHSIAPCGSGQFRLPRICLWSGCIQSAMVLRALSVLAVAVLLQISAAAANPSLPEALRSAKAGHAGSQYVVGMMYLFGQGTAPNVAEGARWIELSARSGMPQALVALANLHDAGYGVPFDEARATQLRQQAAAAGNPTARQQLENDRKRPGERDFRRADMLDDFKQHAAAFTYARRSAEAGNPYGQELLGRAYLYGYGTSKNPAEAVKWFRKSDAGGSASGSRAMGYCV